MHKTAEIKKAAEFILEKIQKKPYIGMILGSGLGSLANEITDAIVIPYTDIPYFAKSLAVGHANELVIGQLENKTVVAMKGRFHYYEGSNLDEITFPIRVMKYLGVEKLFITNAGGAVNTKYKPGDLMLLSDHINLTGANPLMGPNNDELGPRFLDLSDTYNKDLRKLALSIAQEQKILLHEGVYAWWTGPSYETPAEVRMIRTLGADAVGMSTVPEAIIARHSGMDVLGISCLTNMACGILDQALSHSEVIEVAAMAKEKFVALIKAVIQKV